MIITAISFQIKPRYQQEPIFLFIMWLNKVKEHYASTQGISEYLRNLVNAKCPGESLPCLWYSVVVQDTDIGTYI